MSSSSSSSSSSSQSSISSLSSSSSSDSAWDVIYNGDNNYRPDSASQADKWNEEHLGVTVVAVEDDVDCDNGKRFKIDTATDTASIIRYYEHMTSGKPWYDSVNNATGWVCEARIKVIDSGSVKCQGIVAYDGTWLVSTTFSASRVYISASYLVEDEQSYDIDLTDAYHIIRIEVIGTSVIVKIDGVQRITGTLNYSTTTKRILFGDASTNANNGGECYWDYIKYKVT